MNNTRIIAVSGASGAGKTTIVKHLATHFNTIYVCFDDFIEADTYPADMKKWLVQGADLSVIKSPRFTQRLAQLKLTSSNRFIFIEEPFGRVRDSMSHLIDYVILLDLPMELCLARIIQRHIHRAKSDEVNSLLAYLAKYEDHLRDVYISAVNQARQSADLTITEVLPVEATTQLIKTWLAKKTDQAVCAEPLV
ncbi:hypothetical protein BGP78_09440 [Pseudoalteromonas sp. MSK9-3]|uniref:hypothetical protein n=1 Tax=Pseudoalteromonas sp. MSK9-3 TaxID=1897633 RepID=UPI000E6BDA8B|nr:hypothetical protein [Pseudoalteromonas sp. MSK9-3]RJE77266.1 hypothetical protein BGP78_09440 [Pseudoalteromonas sp. MSK9-3]